MNAPNLQRLRRKRDKAHYAVVILVVLTAGLIPVAPDPECPPWVLITMIGLSLLGMGLMLFVEKTEAEIQTWESIFHPDRKSH